MDITLRIYHHHEMRGKKHELIVRTNTLETIMELKQAILDQYPSKQFHFISPTPFQRIVFHGQIFDDKQLVNDLLLSTIPSNNSNREIFPYDTKQGQIVLIQFPRTDKHLKQIHDIITDPSRNIHPISLSQKFQISISRVMKVIHFLQASGFICISDTSQPPTRNQSTHSNLGQLQSIEEQKDNSNGNGNNNTTNTVNVPFIEQRSGMYRNSSAPNLSLSSLRQLHRASSSSSTGSESHSLNDTDRDLLLSRSILRTIASEIAEIILFSDDETSQNQNETELKENNDEDE